MSLKAAGAALCVVGVGAICMPSALATPVAFAVDDGPWAPASVVDITSVVPKPGQDYEVSDCTVAWSFRDDSGRAFAVTAGHCGKAGDFVWPSGAHDPKDFLRPAGRVIHSELDEASDVVVDVGIIEIMDEQAALPVVKGVPEAVAVQGDGQPDPATVCKYGGASAKSCGENGSVVRQLLNTGKGPSVLIQAKTAQLCAVEGDSGAPVIGTIDGQAAIVGMVSGVTGYGTKIPKCRGTKDPWVKVLYVSTGEIMRVIHEVVPGAKR